MEQRFTNPRKWTLTPQGVRATKGFIRGRCKPGYVPVCSCKKEMVNVSPAQQAVRSAFVANVRRGAYRRRAGRCVFFIKTHTSISYSLLYNRSSRIRT